ncbi:MAG TPA: sn-glycerol-3-phosphate ABC transporter ATP-binding protein UgpC [Solirubrobacteraceae bacterium]|jgi:ABC-type sugar transport system ATPase subunit|nr:sn-glycerol-3-phosphate ABC transporter ATP-binding protein UgpC [Solirubrobacteraceae bacterium]
MAAVRFSGVRKRYGDTVAVHGLDLEIGDGEFMVLVGPSGSGKSTALRMLAGLEAITEGEIRIGDRTVNGVAPRERDIAMVFQDYALYPQMTVYDNLAFGLRRRRIAKPEIDERVRRAAAVLRLEPYLRRKPGQLSGGQAQRVALGRALVRDPQVWLMDEPLSNLDAKLRTQTRGEIKRLQQQERTTTVYVTHDQVEAMTMGDRIAVLNEGALEQVGTPEELYERPANTFVGGFIGSPAMAFFAAAAAPGDGGTRLTAAGIDLAVPGAAGLPREVTVGVRPEGARVWDPDDRELVGPLAGEVAFVEALGRETFVGVDVGEVRLVVHGEGRSRLVPGERLEFGLLPRALRFFGADGRAVAAG